MSTLTDRDRATSTPSSLRSHLAKRVQHHLHSLPYRALQNIICEDDGTQIILRGRVPSFYHKQLAQALVLSLTGFGPLANLIEVQGARSAEQAVPDREVRP